ncbi:MAG: hypothetical protein R2733_22910 [Acidimicrobiales bacterium]
MGFGSAKDAGKRGRITADPSTPYVAQLANQLLTFSSMNNVEDLSADEMADLLLVMANAAEHLETQTGQLALAAHRRGVGRHLGSRSTGAWLAHRAKVTPAHAHRMIRRSETEVAFARFYLAHEDGKITGYHLDHLGELWRNNPKLEELLYRDEAMLCDAACSLPPQKFGLVCQKWLSLADPDGAYEKYLLNLERRFYQSSKDLDGNFHLAGRLDPVNGEIFDQLVSKRAAEFFDADWAKAVAEAAPGEVITKSMLRRSDRQRRLDALVSLVIDGSSTPEGAQRPEPSIIFGLDVLSLSEFIAQMLHADLGDWAPDTGAGDGTVAAWGGAAAGEGTAGSSDVAPQEGAAGSAAAGEPIDDTAPTAGTHSGGSTTSASDRNDHTATGNDAKSDRAAGADRATGSDAATTGHAADSGPATNATAASPSGGLRLPDPPYPVPAGPSTAAAVDPMRRCETLRGTPIPFRIMLQHLFEARIRRVVYTAPNVIINASQSRRLFSATQKQLIKFRDRCCTFPGCHRDAIYCEADHLRAFVDGGPTDLTNGQCLCRYHHDLKTRAKFYCEPLPDGTVGFFLPTGIQLE